MVRRRLFHRHLSVVDAAVGFLGDGELVGGVVVIHIDQTRRRCDPCCCAEPGVVVIHVDHPRRRCDSRRYAEPTLCSEALLLFPEPGDVATHNPSTVHEELVHSRLALIVLMVLQLARSGLTYRTRARQSRLVPEGD